jgi:hypothetical protein
MPPMTFLTAMPAEYVPDAVFRGAAECPGSSDLMHHGIPDRGSFAVADMVTADGAASVRVALWRCGFCGRVLAGVGRAGPALDGPPGTGVHAQPFAWLEETDP